MRYLRLLGLFLKANMLVELEYRANFIAHALVSLGWVSITIIGTTVFFTQTDNIGGWTFYETLVISGLFTLMGGLIQMLLQPNVQKIIEMVRLGTMDFVLTKPVNSQFMASLRYAQLFSVVDIIAGGVIIAFAVGKIGFSPDGLTLLLFAVMLLMAVVIVYSIWMIMATCSFWFVKVGNLTELFNSVYDTGRFPVSTFEGILRVLLTLVVPIAFITTFPAQAILGKLEPGAFVGSLVMGAVMFAFSAWFWRYAINQYSSASS
jgi:ABC-2 type transport system permease protein